MSPKLDPRGRPRKMAACHLWDRSSLLGGFAGVRGRGVLQGSA